MQNEVQLPTKEIRSEPKTAPLTPDKTPPPKLSWMGLGIVVAVVWLLFFGGLEALTKTTATIQTGATGVAQTAGAAAILPTAVIATATRRIVPTALPVSLGAGTSPNNNDSNGNVIVMGTPVSTATPQIMCTVITWHDGSQTCNDGTSIDAVHSQPGYCVVVSQVLCANGQPTGTIERLDPEMVNEPTNTPWPAQVTDDIVKSGTTWSGYYQNDGTSCVTVAFSDGHNQTNCGPQGAHYPASNLEFIARMIIDGRLGPGGFPKG